MDAVERSICIYRAILADVAETYQQPGGGGISAIVQKSTNSFEVQISQEGRKDLITYEVTVDAECQVDITSRSEGTKSY